MQSGVKRARQPCRDGHGAASCALKCFSVTFSGSGSGSFALGYPVPTPRPHPPPPSSFHCHVTLCENRRAPVDFTLNPRSRAQSAEDRTACQRWQLQTEIAPLINSWKKSASAQKLGLFISVPCHLHAILCSKIYSAVSLPPLVQ